MCAVQQSGAFTSHSMEAYAVFPEETHTKSVAKTQAGEGQIYWKAVHLEWTWNPPQSCGPTSRSKPRKKKQLFILTFAPWKFGQIWSWIGGEFEVENKVLVGGERSYSSLKEGMISWIWRSERLFWPLAAQVASLCPSPLTGQACTKCILRRVCAACPAGGFLPCGLLSLAVGCPGFLVGSPLPKLCCQGRSKAREHFIWEAGSSS